MIISGDTNFSLEDWQRILFANEPVEIDKKTLEEIKRNYEFLENFSKDKVIYGINTGLGPMAQYRVSEDEQVQLQYNLIRSHCTGSGNTLPDIFVKSLMIARLNTLLKGYSGIHADAVLLLKDFINKNVFPVIYEHGGLGASGDLVQLAHLALAMIGEGEVHLNGEMTGSAKAFTLHNLVPMKIKFREGLALMNGTSAMTGIGLINLTYSKSLVHWTTAASVMISEIVESYDDHYSKELNEVKQHSGQQKIAEAMRNFLSDSKSVRKRADHLYNKKVEDTLLRSKVQEFYSIRCVPQILGPVLDTLQYSENVLLNELNSVNDNPVIDSKNKDVFHGGNFHGDYVSFEMDKIKMAVTKLSMLSERQLNYLLNPRLNEKLPPFVNLGKFGLNLGMQGAQFTATSTVAENQSLSFPVYVHSIPSNNDNQDIVSMGTNAAIIANKVIENTFEVLAIEFIAILQAIDFLNYHDQLSSFSMKIFDDLRKLVPRFEQDAPRYKDIKKIRDFLFENRKKLN
jgi:histidine ammonia-lyase